MRPLHALCKDSWTGKEGKRKEISIHKTSDISRCSCFHAIGQHLLSLHFDPPHLMWTVLQACPRSTWYGEPCQHLCARSEPKHSGKAVKAASEWNLSSWTTVTEQKRESASQCGKHWGPLQCAKRWGFSWLHPSIAHGFAPFPLATSASKGKFTPIDWLGPAKVLDDAKTCQNLAPNDAQHFQWQRKMLGPRLTPFPTICFRKQVPQKQPAIPSEYQGILGFFTPSSCVSLCKNTCGMRQCVTIGASSYPKGPRTQYLGTWDMGNSNYSAGVG